MKKCRLCGKKKLFLRLNSEGYCLSCAQWNTDYEERKRQEREIKLQKQNDKWTEIARLPEYNIKLSDVPRKRRKGFEDVKFSNITPKGVYDNIVVFDTETTGLAPSRDRIIELAAVKYINGNPVEKFHSYVNPERTIPEAAREINGITDDMVAEAPVIGRILQGFEDFVGSSTLVAHNLNFDLRFLFYSGSVITDTKRRYIDTLEQAQRLLKKPKWDDDSDDYDIEDHRLDTLCDYYQITMAKQHSALADAFATGELFFNLVYEKQSQ